MSIKWYQLLFQLINFGILAFLLNRFLYKPIEKIIEQRNKKIHDSIKAAEETLKEKEKIAELKKQARAEAEKEAVAIVEEARKQAGNEGKKILLEAKAEAETEVERKLQLMGEKLDDQERQITSRLTDLVIKTTSKVLKDGLTSKQQRNIIDSQIKKLRDLK